MKIAALRNDAYIARMRARAGACPFGNRPLQPIDAKEIRRAQNGKPIAGTIPEITIVCERFERLQQCLQVTVRVIGA